MASQTRKGRGPGGAQLRRAHSLGAWPSPPLTRSVASNLRKPVSLAGLKGLLPVRSSLSSLAVLESPSSCFRSGHGLEELVAGGMESSLTGVGEKRSFHQGL